VPGGTGPWLATAEALPLAAVRLLAGGRAARIAMTGGIVRSREALDTALVHVAIAAGAHWLPQTAVSAIRLEGPKGRAAAPGRDAAHDADHDPAIPRRCSRKRFSLAEASRLFAFPRRVASRAHRTDRQAYRGARGTEATCLCCGRRRQYTVGP
jgi:hypothetical protein